MPSWPEWGKAFIFLNMYLTFAFNLAVHIYIVNAYLSQLFLISIRHKFFFLGLEHSIWCTVAY